MKLDSITFKNPVRIAGALGFYSQTVSTQDKHNFEIELIGYDAIHIKDKKNGRILKIVPFAQVIECTPSEEENFLPLEELESEEKDEESPLTVQPQNQGGWKGKPGRPKVEHGSIEGL